MNIAITGASGFIGQQVVDEALSQNMKLTLLTRKGSRVLWDEEDNIDTKICDFSDLQSLASALENIDVVLHLAADMHSNNQYQNTMAMTDNLLSAMDQSDVKKIILVSSISVLDYISNLPKSNVIESWTYCENDVDLGNYARMKRDQEKKVLSWRSEEKLVSIVRPGLVYDQNNLSDAHAGFFKSGLGLGVTHSGKVPLVKVSSVAKALVLISKKISNGNDVSNLNSVFHLVDDSLSTQKEYKNMLRSIGGIKFELPIKWQIFGLFSQFIRMALSAVGMGSKIPDTFKKNSVAARLKPFDFSNQKSKEMLGWVPEKVI